MYILSNIIVPAQILEIELGTLQTKKIDDAKNSLNESNKPIVVIEQHVTKPCINISLLADDSRADPCDKEYLCDDDALITVPKLVSTLNSVVFKTKIRAENKPFIPILVFMMS